MRSRSLERLVSARRHVTAASDRSWPLALGSGLALILWLGPGATATAPDGWQHGGSPASLRSEIPIVREEHYTLDGRVRPLLLFWIGRSDIGDARLTWRDDGSGRRAFELLIGSDPLRAPRQINRWGFILETLERDRADTLGIMKESSEDTLEEAEVSIAGETGGMTIFKASRSTISGDTASGGTMTIAAPATLTYRDLDELLVVLPAAPSQLRTVTVPAGTKTGFLAALDTLIGLSMEPCRRRNGDGDVADVPYVYNQTLYDLSLESCDHEPRFETRVGVFRDVVDGRFAVKNRATRKETRFRMMYEASGTDRGVPVRAIFRPHWWIEVELLRANPATTRAHDTVLSTATPGRSRG